MIYLLEIVMFIATLNSDRGFASQFLHPRTGIQRRHVPCLKVSMNDLSKSPEGSLHRTINFRSCTFFCWRKYSMSLLMANDIDL